MGMHNYKELKVWQKAMKLTTSIYAICSTFPEEEKYGLNAQLKRTVVSIPSNIAEGSGRNSDKEFKYFLSIAYGSCYELETQLLISKNVGLITREFEEPQAELTEIMKMMYVLSKSIDKKTQSLTSQY